jgi:hypothetical protein
MQVDSRGSLVCGPETVFGTYLSQSWEVCSIKGGEELIILVIAGPAEVPIMNNSIAKEGYLQLTYNPP